MRETDAQILRESQLGDPGAFVRLTERHGTAVHGYLRRRAGVEAADDLLGEVWVQSFKARASFDERWSDARPWLYGIARNVLRAHWRTSHGPAPRFEAAITDPWTEVDARVDAEVQRRQLEAALDLLTAEEREVLLLVAWERLSPAEIASVLGIPQGTVRSRLHRARSSMRRTMPLAETSAELQIEER